MINNTKGSCHVSTFELSRHSLSKIKVKASIIDKHNPPGHRSRYIPPGDHYSEQYRLSTFAKFPDDIGVDLQASILAKNGFYYTGYKDRIKCFSCGRGVQSLNPLILIVILMIGTKRNVLTAMLILKLTMENHQLLLAQLNKKAHLCLVKMLLG